MIAIITYSTQPLDFNGIPLLHKPREVFISHGIDLETLNNVCLEVQTISQALSQNLIVKHPIYGYILKEHVNHDSSTT